jgi:hypothetical protein
MAISQTHTYKSWCGYAFETVALQHIEKIKEALKISGLYTQATTFYQSSNNETPGAQIDLLLDRNDGLINLIETKFHETPFPVDQKVVGQLIKKQSVFQQATATRKQISWVVLAATGAVATPHSLGIVDHYLSADIFFSGQEK